MTDRGTHGEITRWTRSRHCGCSPQCSGRALGTLAPTPDALWGAAKGMVVAAGTGAGATAAAAAAAGPRLAGVAQRPVAAPHPVVGLAGVHLSA